METSAVTRRSDPWNKGKLVGQKAPQGETKRRPFGVARVVIRNAVAHCLPAACRAMQGRTLRRDSDIKQ